MTGEFDLPTQSPLYHAEHASRYDRQQLIETYQGLFECRLVAVIDFIFPYGVNYFEELVYDADPEQDLHILLSSPGGDGETAIRLVRSAQSRCRELTVIIPDQAKSAATLLALGADHLLMGPTSDLGPVDPQFQMANGSLVAAKDIIAAVEAAEQAVSDRPDTYPLHAALLAEVTDLMVQQARLALGRTDDLMREALKCGTGKGDTGLEDLMIKLRPSLIEAKAHEAIFGVQEAEQAGLPVTRASSSDQQWQIIWRLWAKYFSASARFYEGIRVSHTLPWNVPAI